MKKLFFLALGFSFLSTLGCAETFYGQAHLSKEVEAFKPCPREIRNLHLVSPEQMGNLEQLPRAWLSTGLRSFKLGGNWHTTETLVIGSEENPKKKLDWKKQFDRFEQARIPQVLSTEISFQTASGLLIDRPQIQFGKIKLEKHVSITLTTAQDRQTKASYRRLQTMTTWEGSPKPAIRRIQTVIYGKDGELILFHESYAVRPK